MGLMGSLRAASGDGKPLPYQLPGVPAVLREGQVIMITGRSGSQKSGLAMFLSVEWALREAGVLYFSADMSLADAAGRLASSVLGFPAGGGYDIKPDEAATLDTLPIEVVPGMPLDADRIMSELNVFSEHYGEPPKVIVIDNLANIESTGYAEQFEVMAGLTALAREVGCTVLILHHATEGSYRAQNTPFTPPSRADTKNKLSEYPEVMLGVALHPHNMELAIAVLKQRSGPCDPSGDVYTRLKAYPQITRFGEM